MKRTSQVALVALSVTAVAAGAFFWGRGQQHGSRRWAARHGLLLDGVSNVNASAPCELEVGQVFGYDVNIGSHGVLHTSKLGASRGADAPIDHELKAELALEVLSSDAAGAVVLAKYGRIEGAGSPASLLAPFLLRIAPTCQLTGFARHSKTSAEDARAIQVMAYELNFAAPPSGSALPLEADNGRGHYQARLTAQSTQTGLTIKHERREYLKLWEKSADTVTSAVPKESQLEVLIGEGPWFDDLSSHEALEGFGVSDMRTTVQASRVEVDSQALSGASQDPQQYIWENLLPRSVFPVLSRPVTQRELAAREAVKGQPLEQALASYIDRSRTVENFAEIWPPLTTYLEARPEMAEPVVVALRSGVIPPEGRAAGWVAVGQARTPEARDALLAVMRDGGAAGLNRARAMFALVDRDDIGAPLVTELGGFAMGISAARSDDDRLVAREAALAMGMTAALHKERNPAMTQAALTEVPKLLAAHRTAEALHPVFAAIGNLGEPSTLALLGPYVMHPDSKVRDGVAKTFRRMKVADTTEFLAPWLRRETDVAVKRTLYLTLAKQTHDEGQPADAQVLDQAIADLQAHPGVITRRALIRVLGEAAKTYPPARAALMAQSRKEVQLRSGLYNVVSQYLGANDLTVALSTPGAP